MFHKQAGTASSLIWRGSCINCSTDPPFSIEKRRNQRRESDFALFTSIDLQTQRGMPLSCSFFRFQVQILPHTFSPYTIWAKGTYLFCVQLQYVRDLLWIQLAEVHLFIKLHYTAFVQIHFFRSFNSSFNYLKSLPCT